MATHVLDKAKRCLNCKVPQCQKGCPSKGLEANSRGLLETDEEGHTSRPEIFASGDVVNGARTVVEAVAYSKVVAEAMDRYMQSLKEDNKKEDNK